MTPKTKLGLNILESNCAVAQKAVDLCGLFCPILSHVARALYTDTDGPLLIPRWIGSLRIGKTSSGAETSARIRAAILSDLVSILLFPALAISPYSPKCVELVRIRVQNRPIEQTYL